MRTAYTAQYTQYTSVRIILLRTLPSIILRIGRQEPEIVDSRSVCGGRSAGVALQGLIYLWELHYKE